MEDGDASKRVVKNFTLFSLLIGYFALSTAQPVPESHCQSGYFMPETGNLDRLARSVPDAREIVDALQARGVKLALGTSIYDPVDPMGKMFFNVLATFAEFEGDLIRLRTRERIAIARTAGEAAEAVRKTAERALPDA